MAEAEAEAEAGSKAAAPDRTVVGIVVLVLGLAAFDWARHLWIPESGQLPANVAAAAAVALWARWVGCTAAELGLRRGRLLTGLVWGGLAFAAVTAVVVAAALDPEGRTAFVDDRADVPLPSLLFSLLVDIPFGTVLLEELAFRGVLLGLARRRWATVPAVALSSVLFGMWHLPGAVSAAAGVTGSSVAAEVGGVGTVLGTLAATTVAGVVFSWLRLRSGSLLAPALAHLATNGVALAAAWYLVRAA